MMGGDPPVGTLMGCTPECRASSAVVRRLMRIATRKLRSCTQADEEDGALTPGTDARA